MSTDAVAVTGFAVLFLLMLLRVPVGMAMGLVGITGYSLIDGGFKTNAGTFFVTFRSPFDSVRRSTARIRATSSL